MSTRESPNAPEFFFHHGFIDKIWGDWQEKGHSYKKIHRYYNDVTAMPGTVYSPRDVHDLNNQPYYVKVYYEEPDEPCILAGQRFTAKQISSLSVSARLHLDPTPALQIPRAALTLFQVPQSVINHLPEVTRRLFGVAVPVEPPVDLPDPIDISGLPDSRPESSGPSEFSPRFQRRTNKKNHQ